MPSSRETSSEKDVASGTEVITQDSSEIIKENVQNVDNPEQSVEPSQRSIFVRRILSDADASNFPPTPEIIDSFVYHAVNAKEQSVDHAVIDGNLEASAVDESLSTEIGNEDHSANTPHDSQTIASSPQKKIPKSLTIPGVYGPETKMNPLLGVRCIFCHELINPAPIIQCLECVILNPYICVECFKCGSEGVGHSRDHRYMFIDPKGPRLFNPKSSKRDFGIMEDVAILQMICEFTRENWDEKNIVYPELSYNDALDRLEEILMSDIGTFIRQNDPLAQVRRLLPAELIENFGLQTKPSNVVEMKNNLVDSETRFHDLLEAVNNVPEAEFVKCYDEHWKTDEKIPTAEVEEKMEIVENLTQTIGESEHETILPTTSKCVESKKREVMLPCWNKDEFEDQAEEIIYDEDGNPVVVESVEDKLFQIALAHANDLAKNKAIKGVILNDDDATRKLEIETKVFNPAKFFESLKEKENDCEMKKMKDDEPWGDILPDQSPRKKNKKKHRVSTEAQQSSPEENKKVKKSKKVQKLSFTQHMKLVEMKRKKLAAYRKQLREDDKRNFGVQEECHEVHEVMDNAVEHTDDDVLPVENNQKMPTVREIAFKRLDELIEHFHRNIGFRPDDDWGEKIDDQFGRALDKFDDDYDRSPGLTPEPLPTPLPVLISSPDMEEPGTSVPKRKFKLKPLKSRMLSAHNREFKKKFDEKFAPQFTLEPWKPPTMECQRASSPGIPGTDEPTDGLYHVYEAPFEDASNVDSRTMEDEIQVATYNRIRHDFEIENMNDAETLLNGIGKRHEPIEFSNVVKMCKINSYERVLKERSAQASIAREFNLLPSFMEITKTVTYPVGSFPFLDEQFEANGMEKVKEKYKPFLVPLYQVCNKPMFDDYFKSLSRVEQLKKKIVELQERQKRGDTQPQD